MNNFNAALLQLMPGKNQDENKEIGMKACRRAKEMGADIAVFPEMWSTGYHIPEDTSSLKDTALSIDSDFIQTFAGLAKELSLAVAITFLEAFEPLPRNTVCIFDYKGNLALCYSKVHTCDFGDECRLTPGNEFPVTTLNTPKGEVCIGAMICYDREFPEAARILMLKGAEIILVPNACPMELNRIAQLRTRSFENMTGIATVNYPTGMQSCNGHSTAFDGIAYPVPNGESRDIQILDADETAGIHMAAFPIDQMRKYRENESWGNAYRHPAKYHELIKEEIKAPFIRKDYRN